jgi:hypothetical protein
VSPFFEGGLCRKAGEKTNATAKKLRAARRASKKVRGAAFVARRAACDANPRPFGAT